MGQSPNFVENLRGKRKYEKEDTVISLLPTFMIPLGIYN